MIEEKALLALEKALDEKHEADKAALRRVLKLLKQHGISPSGSRINHAEKPESDSPNGNGNGHAEVGVEAEIIAAIEKTTGPFTLSDLISSLPNIKRSTISSVLHRGQDKTVRVLVKGQGRRAGKYEKMQ